MIYSHCVECGVEFTDSEYDYCPYCGEEVENGPLSIEERAKES